MDKLYEWISNPVQTSNKNPNCDSLKVQLPFMPNFWQAFLNRFKMALMDLLCCNHACFMLHSIRAYLSPTSPSLSLLLFLLEHQEHTVGYGETSEDVDGSHRYGHTSQDIGSSSSWGAYHEDSSQNDDTRQTVAGTH
jgi:hypothetical protein